MSEMQLTATIIPEMRIRPAARQLELGKISQEAEPGEAVNADASDGNGKLGPALPKRLSMDAIAALQEGAATEGAGTDARGRPVKEADV